MKSEDANKREVALSVIEIKAPNDYSEELVNCIKSHIIVWDIDTKKASAIMTSTPVTACSWIPAKVTASAI